MSAVITETMETNIRATVPDFRSEEKGALVPLRGMAAHFVSESDDHPENGLVKLFSVDVDGKTFYVYLDRG